jgi:hypothetical protein
MGAAQIPSDIYSLYEGDELVIADPGSGGTFNLRGKWGGIATIASGTRKLPDNMPLGTKFSVYATGSVTITNVAGTTVATLAAEEIGEFTAKTATTWVAHVDPVGAVEINTAADVPIADAGTHTNNTNVETALQELYGHTSLRNDINTAITTVGAGTLTAGSIVGGLITRSGSTAAYTDTTATGTQIRAALPSGVDTAGAAELSWILLIRNTVAFTQTLAAGTDVTLAGNTAVPPNSVGVFQVSIPDLSANAATITGLGSYPQANVKNSQFSTSAAASPVTVAAGILTGARNVYWVNTTAGAVTVNTRTATEMFADIPGCHIGFNWTVRIVSDGDNTVTLGAGTNVTLTGTATHATNTWKDWCCTFTSATALTMQQVGGGTVDATA